MFADSYALAGKRKDMVISCYLIRHGNDYMLWDAGFGAELAGRTEEPIPGVTVSLKRTIADQLGDLGIKPEQVTVIGISHMHYDHVSQAASFPRAKLLIGAEDLAILSSDPKDPLLEPQRLAPWLKGGAPREGVTGDKDVFGDGSVVMILDPNGLAGAGDLAMGDDVAAAAQSSFPHPPLGVSRRDSTLTRRRRSPS